MVPSQTPLPSAETLRDDAIRVLHELVTQDEGVSNTDRRQAAGDLLKMLNEDSGTAVKSLLVMTDDELLNVILEARERRAAAPPVEVIAPVNHLMPRPIVSRETGHPFGSTLASRLSGVADRAAGDPLCA